MADCNFAYSNIKDINEAKKITEDAIKAFEKHFSLMGNINLDDINKLSLSSYRRDRTDKDLEEKFEKQPSDVWNIEKKEYWLEKIGWSVESLKRNFSEMPVMFEIHKFNPSDEYTRIDCRLGHNGITTSHIFERPMSIKDAEKIVEKTVSHLDRNQNVSILDVKNCLASQINEYNNSQNLTLISDVLSSGKSHTVKNSELGEICVDKGLTGKKGYGLTHIIEGRNNKEKLSDDEITALLCKVVDSVQNGEITVNQPKMVNGKDAGRIGIEKDGIIGFVSKARGDKDEKFVITGFAINEKKKEATEAIRTVIATYGNTPDFSDIRKQVGAVVSSLQQVSPKPGQKSSNKTLNRQLETARKTGYVQGVCECVVAIENDHVLAKKLLTEMKVDKDMAKKYARPKTYKTLEQGIFAPKQDQKLEQKHALKR
jgi:hypothetical protein